MVDEDIVAGWGAMAEAGQQKRASNRRSSADILTAREIAFTSNNAGAHLIVTHNGKTADFWPGTGKWRIRGTEPYKRGVFPLIRQLQAKGN